MNNNSYTLYGLHALQDGELTRSITWTSKTFRIVDLELSITGSQRAFTSSSPGVFPLLYSTNSQARDAESFAKTRLV